MYICFICENKSSKTTNNKTKTSAISSFTFQRDQFCWLKFCLICHEKDFPCFTSLRSVEFEYFYLILKTYLEIF